MQGKYRYKSDRINTIGVCIWIFGLLLLVPAMNSPAFRGDQEDLSFLLLFGWFLVMIAVLGLLGHMPASFCAENTSVTFWLLFRTYRIPYSSIRHMEVTRRYVKVKSGGEMPYYEEELHIICEKDEYHFHAPLKIDMENLAGYPENLQAQFENGMFRRLQLFIDAKIQNRMP